MLEHTLQEHVDAIEKLKETSENERSEFARMKEELSEELKVSNTLSAQMEEEKNEWIQRIQESWEQKLMERDTKLTNLSQKSMILSNMS